MNILQLIHSLQLIKVNQILVISDDWPNCNWLAQKSVGLLNLDIIGLSLDEAMVSLQRLPTPTLILMELKLQVPAIYVTCQTIRQLSIAPLILIIDIDDKANLLAYLEAGVDDYILKSFTTQEFLAKVKMVIERSKSSRLEDFLLSLTRNALTIDCIQHDAKIDGKINSLTITEFHLLFYMLSYPSRLLTYQELLIKVWGIEYKDSIDYLRVAIRRLQTHLSTNVYLRPIPGVGYSLYLGQK